MPVSPAPKIPALLAKRPQVLICLYTLLLSVLQPLLFARLLLRSRQLPAYRKRWLERLGWVKIQPVDIWFHTVSVGEFNAALPLIETLLSRRPDLKLLITTTTPTGSQRVGDALGAAVQHCYLPQDLPAMQHRFLSKAQPDLAVFMETEIWPNTYLACEAQGVPVALINGRLSEKSALGYRLMRDLFTPAFSAIQVLCAQQEQDLAWFESIGLKVDQAVVTGNLKFDLSLDIHMLEQAHLWRQTYHRPVITLASTHEGEERALLNFIRKLQQQRQALLIIVPRHPERAASIKRLFADNDLNAVLESESNHSAKLKDDEILIIDRLGALMFYLATSDLCFMGGSLVPVGGHNFLEPAALGIPTFSGPHLHNFQQIASELSQLGFLELVQSSDELFPKVNALLDTEEALHKRGQLGKDYIAQHQGAVDKTLTALDIFNL